MAFVLDASMTMSWCFKDEVTLSSQAVLTALRSTFAEVPAIWPVEIANVLAVNERRGRLDATQSHEFLNTLASLDIRLHPPSMDQSLLLPIVRRLRLSAYDASYLELAKRRGLVLATLDRGLAKAAKAEGIAVAGEIA